MKERRYRLYDKDILILKDATAKVLHETIGIGPKNVGTYAREDTKYSIYKGRYRIEYDDEPMLKPHIPETEEGFKKKYGLRNLELWKALNRNYRKEKEK